MSPHPLPCDPVRAPASIRRRARLALLVLIAVCAACDDNPRHGADVVLWTSRDDDLAAHHTYGPASFARAEDDVWIAVVDPSGDQPWIQVRHLYGGIGDRARGGSSLPTPAATFAIDGSSFAGSAPSLGYESAGHVFLVYRPSDGRGGVALHVTHGVVGGAVDVWSEPDTIFTGRDVRVAPGRLTRTRQGEWLLPLYADGEDICLRSADGRQWSHAPLAGWLRDALEPIILEAPDGNWVGLARCRSNLVRTISRDAGATWSPFDTLATLPRLDVEIAFAATPADDGVSIAWTETPPDLALVEPGVWALRLAHVAWPGDAGAPLPALELLPPLAWRAAAVPGDPALLDLGEQGLIAWFTTRAVGDAKSAAAEIVWRPRKRPAAPAAPPDARIDDLRPDALIATDLWVQHTLGRPKPSRRLFIESYAMRGLVAAHTAFAPLDPRARRSFVGDTERGLAQARAYAESLLAKQDANGYWSLGYDAKYVADMAVAIGLYAALTPHVDAATGQRYVDSAQRFITGLRSDGLVHADGSVGVGWTKAAAHPDSHRLQDSYVVSTALAGIAAHGWLYARTGDAEDRLAAEKALDYTLAMLAPDGSVAAFTQGTLTEGRHWSATYVQEGWMAADRYLEDARVRAKLRRVLPAHVDWLVRTQNADGTWGDRAAFETTRTVAILDFLVWYDQRCDVRSDVRAAIRRGAAALVDPTRWLEAGMLYHGNQEDAQRVLAARSLVALASGEPVY